MNQGNYPMAIYYFKQAINIYENLSIKYKDYALCLYRLGSVYYKLKDYKSAVKYFD